MIGTLSGSLSNEPVATDFSAPRLAEFREVLLWKRMNAQIDYRELILFCWGLGSFSS
jgi:hypothetical protein